MAMDAASQRSAAFDHIYASVDSLLPLFDGLSLHQQNASRPAVDRRWIDSHANISIPEHTLHKRLQSLGAPTELCRQFSQLFDDYISRLHFHTNTSLQEACLQRLSSSLHHEEEIDHVLLFIRTAQIAFQQKVREAEQSLITLYQHVPSLSPKDRGDRLMSTFEDPPEDGLIVKTEFVSDDDSLEVGKDPKVTYPPMFPQTSR